MSAGGGGGEGGGRSVQGMWIDGIPVGVHQNDWLLVQAQLLP